MIMSSAVAQAAVAGARPVPQTRSENIMPVDDKVQHVAPVSVTVIGTGTGGLETSTHPVLTPAGQPNLVITVIGPLMAIAIRFGNLFLTTLVGLVSAGMVSDVIPVDDFTALLWACAKLSVSVAGLGAIKDTVTIFGKLEARFPLSTGSV